MPSYDYRCNMCSEEFSDVKTVANRLDVACECGSSDVMIMINKAPGFNYDNRMGAYKTSDAFNDRLKEIRKKAGKENTLSDVIR